MKKLLRCLPVMLVAASMLLLAVATIAHTQRTVDHLATNIYGLGRSLYRETRLPNVTARDDPSLRPHVLRALDGWFHPGNDIYAVIVLFDSDGQRIIHRTFGSNARRLAHLGDLSHDAQYQSWMGRHVIASTRRVHLCGVFRVNDHYHIAFAMQTNPLLIALRQMIPVYIMAALLLAALFIPRKKQSPEENADA